MSSSIFNLLNQSNDAVQNYKVIIVGFADRIPLTGAINSDFALAGGNDYSSAGEALRDIPIVGKALDAKSKLGSVVNISGRSAVTELETRKIWNNSLLPDLPISFTLYQSDATSESIMDKVRRIKSAVTPSRDGGLFKAPLGYKFTGQNSNRAEGTLTLQIGRWFRASGLLLVNENCTFSKEVNVNGHPISVDVSLTFQPFRSLTLDELNSWFLV